MISKKLLTFSLIILIFILTIGAVSATDNTTQTDDKNFQDLQSEIDDANENDVIELEGTYSSEGKQIKIDKSLTIQGNATLDGKSSSRIVGTNKNVTFKNINFINGYKKSSGGAVYSSSRTNMLTFINCSFINNRADSGGAIETMGSLTLINCTFKGNHALYGSAVRCTGDRITVKCSTFENHKDSEAIDAWADFILEDSDFINNTCAAIYSILDINAINCNFTNNGKGISCESNANIDNCNFTGNHEGIDKFYIYNTLNIKNSYFGKNVVGISINSDGVIDNGTFIGNNNTAIYSSSWTDEPMIYSISSQDIILNNCRFKSNYGAISNSYNILKINNSSFENHTCKYGSVIYNIGGSTTFKNCVMNNNTPASIIALNDKDSSGSKHIGVINISNTLYKNANLDDSLNKVELVNLTTSKLTTVYGSKDKFKINVQDIETGEVVESWIKIKVYSGTKSKTYRAWFDKKGLDGFYASYLDVGTHKVEISCERPCNSAKATTTVKISKAKTIVKAPKVTNKFKKSAYFKVSAKHKLTKKAADYIIIKLKIGKKTYKVKTNAKGIAKFNTKNLKVGTYKVKITSGDGNYKISAKSTIKIKR